MINYTTVKPRISATTFVVVAGVLDFLWLVDVVAADVGVDAVAAADDDGMKMVMIFIIVNTAMVTTTMATPLMIQCSGDAHSVLVLVVLTVIMLLVLLVLAATSLTPRVVAVVDVVAVSLVTVISCSCRHKSHVSCSGLVYISAGFAVSLSSSF